MNPLITTSEVRQGELLAQTDDAEYRLVSVVYKLNGTDSAAFYCSASDWAQTEAGKSAALYAEIARLRADNEHLRARVLELGSKPITVKEALAITAVGATTDYPYCPECNDGPFATRKGWKAHRRIKHEVR